MIYRDSYNHNFTGYSAKYRPLRLMALLLVLCLCGCSGERAAAVDKSAAETPAPEIMVPLENQASEDCAAGEEAANADTFESKIIISEVLPRPADGEGWVELYNNSGAAVQLADYCLSDSASDRQKCPLPELILPAGGFALVSCCGAEEVLVDSEGVITANFKIGKDETALYLFSSAGQPADSLSWPLTIGKETAVLGENTYTLFPTPGEENSAVTTALSLPVQGDAGLQITEVMRRNKYTLPDANGEYDSWLELYNPTAETVTLSDYFLSDDGQLPAKWRLPALAIEPGEFRIVFLSGKDTVQGEEIHASFRLGSGETELYLLNGATNTVHAYSVPADTGKDISVGWEADGSAVILSTATPGALNTVSATGVFINEVFAGGTYGDSTPDWIELYNSSERAVSLKGWSLSDDGKDKTKWVLPDLTIRPGKYLVIYLTGDTTEGCEEKAPFGISCEGETIFLSDDGQRLADSFSTGYIRPGCSCGPAEEDTAARYYYETPTPGAANKNPKTGYVSSPVFSRTELYAETAFELTISCPDSSAVIYYTLDGSEPTEQSALYEGPILISQNTAVSAAAFEEGRLSSSVVTATYLFESRHSVPVMCMVGDKAGIDTVKKTTWEQRYNKPESKVTFTYYEQDGTRGCEFPAGIRAKGNSALKYSHKAFTIHLRGAYGQSDVTYSFFEDSSLVKFSALSLRGGGQDRGKARLRDSFFMRVADGLNLENVSTRVVVLYINGEYYGVFDLDESQNASYFAAHYGVDEDDVDIIRRNDEVLHGSGEDFADLRAFARNTDFSDDANFAALAERIDVDYFTDYLIFQSYIANSDMFNQKYWRAEGSIKWRPILFDLDYGLAKGALNKNVLSSYFNKQGVPSANKTLTNMDIYCALVQNAAWRDTFAKRYVELVYTAFSPERLHPLLEEMAEVYRAEMPRQYAQIHTPGSLYTLNQHINTLHDYIDKRPEIALKYLQKVLKLSDEEMDALQEPYAYIK